MCMYTPVYMCVYESRLRRLRRTSASITCICITIFSCTHCWKLRLRLCELCRPPMEAPNKIANLSDACCKISHFVAICKTTTMYSGRVLCTRYRDEARLVRFSYFYFIFGGNAMALNTPFSTYFKLILAKSLVSLLLLSTAAIALIVAYSFVVLFSPVVLFSFYLGVFVRRHGAHYL